jgi:hypothetical protein
MWSKHTVSSPKWLRKTKRFSVWRKAQDGWGVAGGDRKRPRGSVVVAQEHVEAKDKINDLLEEREQLRTRRSMQQMQLPKTAPNARANSRPYILTSRNTCRQSYTIIHTSIDMLHAA